MSKKIAQTEVTHELGRTRRGARRVTMTDVAREAGCSQATVSFVLNNAPGIRLSAETRARVVSAARKLGYAVAGVPHAGAGSANRVIGFVVDQLATSPEAMVAIEGVSQAARADGSFVLVSQTFNDAAVEKDVVRQLVGSGAAAIVYMTIFTREVELPDDLAELELPLYLLNCYTADQTFPAVIPSEVAGGQRCTRYLIEHGHSRIATITGELWMEAAQDRLKGYRRALATADIPFDPDLVVEGDWSASSGFEGTCKLLNLDEPPTAIFCQNDRTAIGCYEALKEAGLVIPTDMSVVGYDDEEIARHLHPQLTTSVLPHRAMGQWVIEQMQETNGVRLSRYPLVKLECPLVERASVSTPPVQVRPVAAQ